MTLKAFAGCENKTIISVKNLTYFLIFSLSLETIHLSLIKRYQNTNRTSAKGRNRDSFSFAFAGQTLWFGSPGNSNLCTDVEVVSLTFWNLKVIGKLYVLKFTEDRVKNPPTTQPIYFLTPKPFFITYLNNILVLPSLLHHSVFHLNLFLSNPW